MNVGGCVFVVGLDVLVVGQIRIALQQGKIFQSSLQVKFVV